MRLYVAKLAVAVEIGCCHSQGRPPQTFFWEQRLLCLGFHREESCPFGNTTAPLKRLTSGRCPPMLPGGASKAATVVAVRVERAAHA